jgi:hypothetical protein
MICGLSQNFDAIASGRVVVAEAAALSAFSTTAKLLGSQQPAVIGSARMHSDSGVLLRVVWKGQTETGTGGFTVALHDGEPVKLRGAKREPKPPWC